MRRQLPSLDWLRVFAATASTESFALSANQLGVTAGAVSQRIKALEAYLEVELFRRHPQGVRLTEAGRRYAERILPPLEQLAAATRDLVGDDAISPVRITVLPALAQLWLGPRLDSFHRLHESTSVEIWADATVVDLRNSTFDVALRYGRPPFAGGDHRELLVDELVPVASPAVAETAERDSAGLPIGVPLMLDTYWTNDLETWLDRTGNRRPPGLVAQTFSLYSMTVEAVVAGRGFMIGHSSLLSDLIANGKLVELSRQRVPAANQFYLLTNSTRQLSASAETFIDWLMLQ